VQADDYNCEEASAQQYTPVHGPAGVGLTEMTVTQYGKAFHASSCMWREPLGAIIFTILGTLLK